MKYFIKRLLVLFVLIFLGSSNLLYSGFPLDFEEDGCSQETGSSMWQSLWNVFGLTDTNDPAEAIRNREGVIEEIEKLISVYHQYLESNKKLIASQETKDVQEQIIFYQILQGQRGKINEELYHLAIQQNIRDSRDTYDKLSENFRSQDALFETLEKRLRSFQHSKEIDHNTKREIQGLLDPQTISK